MKLAASLSPSARRAFSFALFACTLWFVALAFGRPSSSPGTPGKAGDVTQESLEPRGANLLVVPPRYQNYTPPPGLGESAGGTLNWGQPGNG